MKGFLAFPGGLALLTPERVGDLIAAGRARVKVLRTDERWFGITYKEDKPFVEEAVRGLVEQGVYPPSLWDA